MPPSVLEKLKSPKPSWIEFSEAIINGQTLSIEKNNIWYHSKRDPYRETKRIINDSDFSSKSHVIFLGSGLGYVVEEALKIKRFSSLLLIEPDLEILFYVLVRIATMENIDYSRLSIFIPSQEINEDFDAIFPYLKGKSISEFHFYSHSASFQAFSEIYLPLRKNLMRLIEKRMINQATLIKFQKIWNKNILLNSREISSSGCLKDMIQTKSKATIILAGAGPSLTHHKNILHQYRSKFLLFAVDTSYVPLLKMGFVPDFVFSSDPQWINHYYVLDSRVNQSIWVLDPTVCPVISHWLSSNKATMFWWDNPFYLDGFFRSASRGTVSHGGSVSTNAFDVAFQIGAENIILIGQDLSFTDSMAHVKGSVLEEMVFIRANRFYSMETHNYLQLTALPPIKVDSTSKDDKYAFTNAKLMVYIEWFKNQAAKHQLTNSKPRLIHADPRGVLLSGFDKVLLEDFFHQKKEKISNNQKIDISFIKQAMLKVVSSDLQNQTEAKVEFLRSQITLLKELYTENIRLIKQYMNTRQHKCMKKIEENDKKILCYQETNKIISISAQGLILGITENNTSKDPLHTSLVLYSTMQKVTKTFLYLLEKVSKSN